MGDGDGEERRRMDGVVYLVLVDGGGGEAGRNPGGKN